MSYKRFPRAGFSPAFLTVLASAALAAWATASLGCQPASSGPGATSSPTAADTTSPTARSYTVRGVVLRAATDGREWQIHHEALPEFVGIDGKVEPMDAMVMPFPIDAQVAGDLRVGDKIRFTFQVDWQGSPPLLVTRWERLPADTRLSFEAPAP